MIDHNTSELQRALSLARDALLRLVGEGQLHERLADDYIDSLSKIRSAPNFPQLVIDLLAKFDEALGHESEAAIVDRLDDMSDSDAVHLAQKAVALLRELDTATSHEGCHD